jgi:uncharacterized protein YndB with AHSA1/START domain
MSTNTPEIVIERIFNAPRELVWHAWTQREHLMKWWGPKTFTCPDCTIDFREGGKYHYSMMAPEGTKFWITGTFETVRPMDHFSYTDSFADEHGNVVGASHYGMSDDMPKIMQVILDFEDLGGKTKMTLVHRGLPAGEMSEQTKQGWNEMFDKLDSTLE